MDMLCQICQLANLLQLVHRHALALITEASQVNIELEGKYVCASFLVMQMKGI